MDAKVATVHNTNTIQYKLPPPPLITDLSGYSMDIYLSKLITTKVYELTKVALLYYHTLQSVKIKSAKKQVWFKMHKIALIIKKCNKKISHFLFSYFQFLHFAKCDDSKATLPKMAIP